ncbi:ArsB/NhaD family transporter [Alkalihalobacillus sp. AL-G]|uniref:ArsB/NhaD family transporter n=1 Tax=Alkalihalobacillus sp. AL-G TaxID=2926399 RepID=UPI00272A8BF7|nr:ArsB/NhaD family transporter [Alkalihalobacillus sp. AL-G]WLD92216.1 ArsB/NhaD family transporter [Alkalihalobacillus sp. AL-G]
MDVTMASLIFIISYIGIMTEKINRALVACCGAVVMLILGILQVEQAFFEHVDWNTIALLFSMMILVSITSQNGVFEYIAIKLAQKVKGRPIPLLVVLSTITAIGSALLDNVTTVLLLVPIILTLTSLLHVTSMPYLISAILFANIGGTATLIGDPPNIMIGQAVEHLDFNDFLFHLGPVVLIIFIVIMSGVVLFYRRSLYISQERRNELLKLDPNSFLKKGPLLYKSVSVLSLTILGFLLHTILHLDITTVAMSGALLLLLITSNEQEIEEVFRSIEWITLFFFIGLFILVGGLIKVGIIDEMARSILLLTEGDLPKTAIIILWGSGLLSGFIDNIPFVAAMIPVIMEFEEYGMQNLDPLWWSLALGACLGGNATLIGASANVIVAGMAMKSKQSFSFIQFLLIGFPVVIVSLVIATIYILLRYLLAYF